MVVRQKRVKCLSSACPRFELGFVTLIISLILLFSLTLVTLYSAKRGLIEQQISANERRSKEAFTNAERAVEEGIAHLRAYRRNIGAWSTDGRWASCAANPPTFPCEVTDGSFVAYRNVGLNTTVGFTDISELNMTVSGDYTLHYLAAASGGTILDKPQIEVVANGTSDDGSANRVVRQSLYFYSLIGDGPDAPMTVSGTITLSGDIHIVANTMVRDNTFDVSTWSSGAVVLSGSVATCSLTDFLGGVVGVSPDLTTYNPGHSSYEYQSCSNCDCSSNSLSISNDINDDIIIDNTNFPADLFAYVFGVPETEWETIKAQALQILHDCSLVSDQSNGLIWVEQDCNLLNGMGSYQNPVILVVNGNITLSGTFDRFGLLFAFNSAAGIAGSTVTLGGNSTFYGAIVSDSPITNQAGESFYMRYDAGLLSRLGNGLTGSALGKVPGSWIDL